MKATSETWAIKRKSDGKVWQDLSEREVQLLILGCIRFEKEKWLIAKKSKLLWENLDQIEEFQNFNNVFNDHQNTPAHPPMPTKK